MGIGMMVMIMPVAMVVAMTVPMFMIVVMMVTIAVFVMMMIVTMVMNLLQRRRTCMTVHRRPWQAVFLAELLIPAGCIAIAIAGTILEPAADTFDVVVVAFLRKSDFGLEAKHLLAVLAHLAVHQRLAVEDLLHTVLKRIEHERMVVEIRRLDELDIRVAGRDLVGLRIDPLHQHAGKQKVRKHDHTLVAELRGMGEPGGDQRERDA